MFSKSASQLNHAGWLLAHDVLEGVFVPAAVLLPPTHSARSQHVLSWKAQGKGKAVR